MTGSRRMERKVGLAPCQARGDDWGRVRFGKTKAAEPTTALLAQAALTSVLNVPTLFRCSLTAASGAEYLPAFRERSTLKCVEILLSGNGTAIV
jgi:hypothetical protein